MKKLTKGLHFAFRINLSKKMKNLCNKQIIKNKFNLIK